MTGRNQTELFGLQSFHNSTGERDEKRLSGYEETSQLQDKKILEFMSKHPKNRKGLDGWTSSELEAEFPRIPRESIRRALTNNSKDTFNQDGHVFTHGDRRKGQRGRGCLVWHYYKTIIGKPSLT